MKRVFAALFLTLAFAAIFTRSDAGLPLRGGSGSGGGSTPLATFLASCAPDQWCQPSNTNAVASNVYYATATGAVDYNATTATDNQGVEGASANWTIWSGGAYDTTLNRIIAFGGLHHSYCGNEGYAFDIPNLNAYRMRTPSDYQTATTINISSGTYDSTTGSVTLTLASPMFADAPNGGSNWHVASLTGTGSIASLEGDFTTTAAAGSASLTYTGASGLGTITITGGKIFEGCGEDTIIKLNNGDSANAHEYSAPLFIPHGSCNTAPDGSWFILQPDGTHIASLDLSKGLPYASLPTTLGAPGSGWDTTVAYPQSPVVYGATTPSLQAFDPATCRIYSENNQIGGGPPDIYYYDMLAQTFSTSGLTGTNGGIPGNNCFTGVARSGHGELWGFGTTGTDGASRTGNAMRVAFSDGTSTIFSLTNYSSLPTSCFVGVCYAASVDKFFIWGGGDTLVVEDASTQTDTTYTPSVAAGVTLPPLNVPIDQSNNGAMTKMVCDETDHIIVLWWEGNAAPWILKTSKF